MSQESSATKRGHNLQGGGEGLYGFPALLRISDFESRIAIQKDLLTNREAGSAIYGEWRRVTVVTGWVFNESLIGEPLDLTCGFPQLESDTCCVWIELILTLNDEYHIPDDKISPPTPLNGTLTSWNKSINSAFSQSSRVRELSSLTSAAALQVLPRLSSGLELYYIYCWEGNNASIMSKAKAVQSALLLERALLTAFYQSPGVDRFISRRLLDGVLRPPEKLIPLKWLRDLSPSDLRLTANSVLNENRLLFRLISQHLRPVSSASIDDGSNESSHLNSGWSPPSTGANQAVSDIRMLAEQLPQSLPSKRVLTSLLLPANPLQNEALISADGPAEIRIGSFSDRHAMRTTEEEADETSDPFKHVITLGGSMSFAQNNPSLPAQRPGSEQQLSRPINRPTLPQLKSLNLQRRRPAERREDGLGGGGGPTSESPPIGVTHDSHRTSSLSATPHEHEEVISTQRSVKTRRLHSNSLAPPRAAEEASGPPQLLGSQSSSSSSSFSSESDDDDVRYGENASLSPSSSSIASSPQGEPRLLPRGKVGGFMKLPPPLMQRSTLGLPELDLLGSARYEPADDLEPPSCRSPEVDRNSALAKYRYICSEIIENQLYLSGEGVASSLEILQENRISHIINSAGDTCPNYFPGQFNYLTFVLQDSRLTNEALEAVLFFALDFIQRAIDSGGRVLVHCREGVSRSCTLVCAYLMCSRRMTFQAALEQVREIRETCNPNTGFTFTLLKLGKRLYAAENGGDAGIGDKKLSRVAIHHPAAPFMVVLGVSLWEPTHQSWMPGGKALCLDPRFYYVLRVHPCIYVWKGSAIPKHMDRLMRKAIERYINDIKKYEKLPDEVCQVLEVDEGAEPDEFWTTLYVDAKHVPSIRVMESSALNEEALYLANEFPHVSVFDMEEWESQLQKIDDETPKIQTFGFVPPKSTPRTMEAAKRNHARHLGRHDSPLVTGSATHRVEMTPLYAASTCRVRDSFGLATDQSRSATYR